MGGTRKKLLRPQKFAKNGRNLSEEDDNHKNRLHQVESEGKWPIVYAPKYNISFLGLEKLHPFDSGKWGRVFNYLKENGMLNEDRIVKALEISENELLFVHTTDYLNSLKWSFNVARVTEIPLVACLPNSIVHSKVLRPLKYQTGGTVMAGKLAVDRGWAINIGGGFHHCSANNGGGFCAYADITLCIKYLFASDLNVTKAMIVDLDAHQGNGHERDFKSTMNDVYIMDVYNSHIYPRDRAAKASIRKRVELEYFVEDEEYLRKVEKNLLAALNEFQPDIIIYNAGTDILRGDRLGLLSISPEGIIKRDQIVFTFAKRRKIPIVMVTSGGYLKETAEIIANSILNLKEKGLIQM